jgi:dimeric dUTPase (all-alpha-NTP-PPase superfamily)
MGCSQFLKCPLKTEYIYVIFIGILRVCKKIKLNNGGKENEYLQKNHG